MTGAAIREWHGPDAVTARANYAQARAAGCSELRARVLGHVGSHKDCWTLQSTIAELLGCCIRTVQRGLRDGRELEIIGCAFGKKGERPPGSKAPMLCKWSHRWTKVRGLVDEALRIACLTKAALRRTFNAPQAQPPKAKPRKPPKHLSREQRVQWLEEQLAIEPSTSEVVQREPEPPER